MTSYVRSKMKVDQWVDLKNEREMLVLTKQRTIERRSVWGVGKERIAV